MSAGQATTGKQCMVRTDSFTARSAAFDELVTTAVLRCNEDPKRCMCIVTREHSVSEYLWDSRLSCDELLSRLKRVNFPLRRITLLLWSVALQLRVAMLLRVVREQGRLC